MVHLEGIADNPIMANGNFTNVELPEGYSGKDLRAAEWWLEHKASVKKVALGLFAAFDVLLIGIGTWGILDWLAIGGVTEERAMRQMASPAYAQLGGLDMPQEIRLDAPIVLAVGDDRYDAITPIENPNANYWVEVEYVVAIGGEESAPRVDFVLPGQSKYLLGLGLRRGQGGGRADLRVLRRDWHRVDAHMTGDYAEFAERRLAFVTGDATFTAGAGQQADVTSFDVRNTGAYNFRRVGFTVLLYRGSAIVGANRASIENFRSGQSRTVDLFWFQNLPQVTRTEVIPDVNILDPDVYLALGA